MTGQELAEHAAQLADDLDTALWVCGNCAGIRPAGELRSYESGGQSVYLSQPPDTPMAYLVALHELGHAAKDHGFGRPKPRLTAEYEAWHWALEHAITSPGAEEWAGIAQRLRTYTNDRRYRQDPNFYRLLEVAEERQAA